MTSSDKQLTDDTSPPPTKNDDVEIPVIVANVTDNNHNNKTSKRDAALLVAESETVPAQVKWEPEHRQYHDKLWGILYILCFLIFVAAGSVLVAKAKPRYEWVTATGNATTTTDDEQQVRIISSHFRDDVAKCCVTSTSSSQPYTFDLCSELTTEDAVRRRFERRVLQSNDDDDFWKTTTDDDMWNTGSTEPPKPRITKYEQGDGMFDAFLEAPEIIVTMCLLALFLALLWVVLLRFFAVPIVYATEVLKVAFFLYLFVRAVMEEATGAAIVSLLCAAAVVAWDIYTFKQLQFAGKVLSHAAQSFKENVDMFCAFLPLLILYAGNAGLFVLFFARSFEVVEVQSVTSCWGSTCETGCYYVSPSYTTPIVTFLSLAYLWSILLFSTMRLSIIANVIGSWHFHPDNRPGVGRAVLNTCTTSMGTLSVASLVATICEKLNRMFLAETMWKNCCNPIFWIILPLYCVFGTCLRMLVLMLTKFCVILHVFSGKSWMGSAKKVFKILKRHFKGGFVTEYASNSVLTLGSYVFSIAIYFIAWVWLDREFKTETFIDVNEDSLMVVVWLFFALFNIWYPVLGLYIIILLNRWFAKWESLDPATWVTPFAATFIACIAMMFFTYLAGIFMDTVDTLFLCFAIDRDNNVDMSDDEFAKLVQEGVPTVLEVEAEKQDEEAPEQPIPIVVTGVEPVPAP